METRQKKRKKIWLRLIAFIIVIAYVCQNAAWVQAQALYKNIAPESLFETETIAGNVDGRKLIVLSDIHDNNAILEHVLNKYPSSKVIFNGDLIGDGITVAERVFLDGGLIDKGKAVGVLGNHEIAFLDVILGKGVFFENWYRDYDGKGVLQGINANEIIHLCEAGRWEQALSELKQKERLRILAGAIIKKGKVFHVAEGTLFLHTGFSGIPYFRKKRKRCYGINALKKIEEDLRSGKLKYANVLIPFFSDSPPIEHRRSISRKLNKLGVKRVVFGHQHGGLRLVGERIIVLGEPENHGAFLIIDNGKYSYADRSGKVHPLNINLIKGFHKYFKTKKLFLPPYITGKIFLGFKNISNAIFPLLPKKEEELLRGDSLYREIIAEFSHFNPDFKGYIDFNKDSIKIYSDKRGNSFFSIDIELIQYDEKLPKRIIFYDPSRLPWQFLKEKCGTWTKNDEEYAKRGFWIVDAKPYHSPDDLDVSVGENSEAEKGDGSTSGALKSPGPLLAEATLEEFKDKEREWRKQILRKGSKLEKYRIEINTAAGKKKPVVVQAKVFQVENLPEGVPAWQFREQEGNFSSPLIIVTRDPPEEIPYLDELLYHEDREALWLSQGLSRREAHVLASAEQVLAFRGKGTLSPFHQSRLKDMSVEELRKIIEEDRSYHYEIIHKYLVPLRGPEIIEELNLYENLFCVKASEALGIMGNWIPRVKFYPTDRDPFFVVDFIGINKNAGIVCKNVYIRAKRLSDYQKNRIRQNVAQKFIGEAEEIKDIAIREHTLRILNHVLANLEDIWLLSGNQFMQIYGDRNCIGVAERLFSSAVGLVALFHGAGLSYFDLPDIGFAKILGSGNRRFVHQYLRGIGKTDRVGRKVERLFPDEKGLQDELFGNLNLRLSAELLRCKFFYQRKLLSTKTRRPYYVKISLPGFSVEDMPLWERSIPQKVAEYEYNGYLEKIDRSARVLLPYPKLLTAVNVLLWYIHYEKAGVVKKLVFHFYQEKDGIHAVGDTLHFYFKSPEDMDTIAALKLFEQNLGWNFMKATIDEMSSRAPYLLLDSDDFTEINIVLPKSMAGMGDFVFVVNASQVLKGTFPKKKVRVVFNRDRDFQIVCQTGIVKGIQHHLACQEVNGVEYVNTAKLKEEIVPAERSVSIVYALGGTMKEVFRVYDDWKLIKIMELGFEGDILRPREHLYGYLGFDADQIGLAPVSPDVMGIYHRKYPRSNKRIRNERRRIIKKIPGWALLDEILAQRNLERTVASEWGFIYAHEEQTVKKYFEIFETAREEAAKKVSEDQSLAEFIAADKTFFVMCSRRDSGVQDEIRRLARRNGYNLFIYSDKKDIIQPDYVSGASNITIIMDFSVPRKLFSELFLYSDDLPTVVTGQDNLSNIIYLNLLSSGRPFYWEKLIFQGMAGVRFKKLIADKLGKDFAETLSKLWPVYNEDMSVSAEMFFAPRKWREFFRKIAVTVEGESNSFISQVYYLMLRCLARQGVKKRICDAAVREITDNDVLLSL